MRVQIPHGKAQFLGKGAPIIKYKDFLQWAEQKWLYRSTCRLGCGLRWAKGSKSSIIFARWRQCALMGGTLASAGKYDCCMAAADGQSAVAMRPYVKLLLLL